MQPEGMGTAVPPDRQAAKSALMAPAIILIIIAALGILLGIIGLALPQVFAELLARAPQNDPNMEKLQETLQAQRGVNIIQYVLLILLSGTVLFGSIQMVRLRSYGLARAAAIISIIPCVGSCCGLGIPFGIWALVVLMKPHVKAAFQ